MSRMNDLSKAIIKLEHLLESDPRTFKNPKSENGWIFDDIHEVLKILKSMSCSEFPNNWIPCSERLPEDDKYDETFMVTIQCEHIDGWDDYVTGFADWTPHGWDIQTYYVGQIKVVAWKPLDDPWKPESEE